MAKLANQWLPIFRAGDYGDKGKYTEGDLDQIVANYDPKFHEAPACIGHPESDKPAFGFVEQVRREGSELFAKLKDSVYPKFEEAVRDGRFPKRSASFYTKRPDGTRHLSLRHVGFLGALPPDVKGLADPVFHDDAREAVVSIEFMEDSTMATEPTQINEDKLVDRLTKFFSEQIDKISGKKSGTGNAEQVQFGEDQVRKIVEDSLKPLRDENVALKTQFAERESAATTATQKAAVESAIARLQKAGRWLPAFDRMGGVQIFEELAKSAVTVEFAEGDKKSQVTPLALFTNFMEGLPKFVPTGETFKGATFAEGSGKKYPSTAEPNSIKLNDLAEKHAKDNKVSFGEALTAVSIEHPELTRPGGASGGAV